MLLIYNWILTHIFVCIVVWKIGASVRSYLLVDTYICCWFNQRIFTEIGQKKVIAYIEKWFLFLFLKCFPHFLSKLIFPIYVYLFSSERTSVGKFRCKIEYFPLFFSNKIHYSIIHVSEAKSWSFSRNYINYICWNKIKVICIMILGLSAWWIPFQSRRFLLFSNTKINK